MRGKVYQEWWRGNDNEGGVLCQFQGILSTFKKEETWGKL